MHRSAVLSTGRKYHFVDHVPENYSQQTAHTILCIHGFPDFWYGWRYQIPPWTNRGYRVVVPDMLGYGGTDKPDDAIEYTTKRLSDDLASLLDHLGVHKAIIVGHDWGAYTAGRFALWHPDRLSALILLSAPFQPPKPTYVSLEELATRRPQMRYQTYLAETDTARHIEDHLLNFFKTTFRVPDGGDLADLKDQFTNPSWVDKQPLILNSTELELYATTFRGGMQGPLNYYRTSRLRFDEEQAAQLPSSPQPDLPVLFMWGTLDPTAMPSQIERARAFIPRLQNIPLHGKGHWIMVEAHDEVSNGVLDWLDSLDIVPRSRL